MDNSQDNKKPAGNSNGISRRSFLKGFGLTSVTVATIPGSGLFAKWRDNLSAASGKLLGKNGVAITLDVNGKTYKVDVEPRMTLADVLRDNLNLTGTKIGCNRGACGACTVMIGGKTVTSCMTLVLDAVGQPITTIEGLSVDGKLDEIQKAFIEHDALQCGFCTSGMIMSCKSLLASNPNPSLGDVRAATSGNLCRCGTYPKVFDAVLAVGGDG